MNLLWLVGLFFLPGIAWLQAGPTESPPQVRLTAEPWPQADALFHQDPHWLGGDDAYSIDLGKGRVVWLFADSFVAARAGQSRQQAVLVRNTVAIQQGYDPSTASIQFYWRTTKNGQPASFFSEKRGFWYWPGHGAKVDGQLLVFLMKVRSSQTGLGFEVFGSDLLSIANPDDEPGQWKFRWLPLPKIRNGIIPGAGAVLAADNFIYVFSPQEGKTGHTVYLTRWPLTKISQGEARQPEWWCGPEIGWRRLPLKRTSPAALWFDGQTEFTVHYDSGLGRLVEVQTDGFGGASVVWRSADRLTGPWAEKTLLHRPVEASQPDALIYAGKSHPELTGADVIVTYVVNRSDFGRLVNDPGVYYPRFIRCRWRR